MKLVVDKKFNKYANLEPVAILLQEKNKDVINVFPNVALSIPVGYSQILNTGMKLEVEENEVVLMSPTNVDRYNHLLIGTKIFTTGKHENLVVGIFNASNAQMRLEINVPFAALHSFKLATKNKTENTAKDKKE